MRYLRKEGGGSKHRNLRGYDLCICYVVMGMGQTSENNVLYVLKYFNSFYFRFLIGVYHGIFMNVEFKHILWTLQRGALNECQLFDKCDYDFVP